MIILTVDTSYSIEELKNNWLQEAKPKLKVCLKCRHCWLPHSPTTKYCPNCKNKHDSIKHHSWKKKTGRERN